MISIEDILSYVQSEIGDLSEDKIQRKEYVYMLNDTAIEIAKATQVWVDRYQVIPNPTLSEWQSATYYRQGAFVVIGGSYYRAVIDHTSTTSFTTDLASGLWTEIPIWADGTDYTADQIVYNDGSFYRATRTHTASADNAPDHIEYWETITSGTRLIYEVRLPESISSIDLSPYKLTRVVRGGIYVDALGDTAWVECEEFSIQTINRGISGNTNFEFNRKNVNDYGYAILNTNGNDDVNGLTLVFGKAFEAGEIASIDYISAQPFRKSPFTMWIENPTNPITIPEWLNEVFQQGVLYRACERIYNVTTEANMMTRANRIRERYDKALNDASGYAKKLKDTRSVITAQPNNFLEE